MSELKTKADSTDTKGEGEPVQKVDANDYSRFEDISDSDSDGDGDQSGSKSDDSKTATQRLEEAGLCKNRGNEAFKAGDNSGAAEQYRNGMKALEDMSKSVPPPNLGETKECQELTTSLQLNLAMAEIRCKNFRAAITAASAVIKMDEKNIKALFRRGVAHSKSGDLQEAKADLLKVLKLDEANSAAKKELQIVKKKIQEHKAASKKGFSNLFERAGGVYDDKEQQRRERAERKRREEEAQRRAWQKENDRRKEVDEEEVTFEEWKKEKEEAEKKAKEEEEARAKERKAKEQEARKQAKAAKKEEAERAELDDEDETLVKDLKKGYCYFRRTQSEQEKALIGDIAPKKVTADESPAESSAPLAAQSSSTPQRIDANSASSAGSRSAWNSEGTTWEDKDCSAWAKDAMKRCLESVSVSSGLDGLHQDPAAVSQVLKDMSLAGVGTDGSDPMESLGKLASSLSKATARITKVSKCEGDASVAVVRGRSRYLFDLVVDMDYEISIDESFGLPPKEGDKPKEIKYKGKLSIPEASQDSLDELEFVHKSKGSKPKPMHQARVTELVQELKKEITTKSIPAFVKEFQDAH